MTTALSGKAASLKLHLQQETVIALRWVELGSVRDDSTFRDGDGHQPFQGCLERLTERTQEMASIDERWDQETLSRWCKAEADVWFDGFPDDTASNRMDFAASLYSLAITQLRLSKEAFSQTRH